MGKIWVKAIRLGYYGMARRYPESEHRKADVFEIEEKEFSKAWMKQIRPPTTPEDDELPEGKPTRATKPGQRPRPRPSDESKI